MAKRKSEETTGEAAKKPARRRPAAKKQAPPGKGEPADPHAEHKYPTAEQCATARAGLESLHGVVEAPGGEEPEEGGGPCGAKPSVLDSLVGTILSQNTTDITSARAFASLKAFHTILHTTHSHDESPFSHT